MRVTIEPPPEADEPQPPLWKKWAWFGGLALVSTLATAIVAYALKALLV